MKPYISLITLGVDDIQRSRTFYEHVLNFPLKVDLGAFVFFELNNTVFSIGSRDALAKDIRADDSNQGFSGITLAHNVNTDEEVVEIIEAVRQAGCTIVKEPKKVDWGDCLGAYFRDPDGHLWEVTSNPSGMYETHTSSDSSVERRENV